MGRDWLLIETFGGGRGPSVMAQGNTPKTMVPLARILRDRRPIPVVHTLLERIQDTCKPLELNLNDGTDRRVIGDPVTAHDGLVHGVFVWIGRPNEESKPHNPAGAWRISITHRVSSRSDPLLDLYGAARERRVYDHDIAELFDSPTLRANSDDSDALAILIKSQPGQQLQKTWTITRADNGMKRLANFACRCIEIRNERNDVEVVIRGITHDIGSANDEPTARGQRSFMLARQVVLASATPGQARAVVDLKTMQLMEWIDDPLPGIAWRLKNRRSQFPPGIHRDDLGRAVAMRDALSEGEPVMGLLRFRNEDGGWTSLEVTANLMSLTLDTNAALVTLKVPSAHRSPSQAAGDSRIGTE